MNQKEKLIELLRIMFSHPEKTCVMPDGDNCFDCKYFMDGGCDHYSREADYLLANGVIVLPCKVGDTVYCLATPCGGCQCYNEIMCEEFIDRCKNCHRWEIIEVPFSMELYDEFGKTVFLTRKDAETALREREDNA